VAGLARGVSAGGILVARSGVNVVLLDEKGDGAFFRNDEFC